MKVRLDEWLKRERNIKRRAGDDPFPWTVKQLNNPY